MRALEREPDERPLIAAAQTDPAQFAHLYERNFDRIYAFFTRRVATREEAQDLTPKFSNTPWLLFEISNGRALRLSRGFTGLLATRSPGIGKSRAKHVRLKRTTSATQAMKSNRA